MSVLVTIDGVSGTFKTWITEEVAKYYGWQYLSCGLIYRAIAFYGYSLYKDSFVTNIDNIINKIDQIKILGNSIIINNTQYQFSDLRKQKLGTLTAIFAQDIIVQNFIHNTIRKHVEHEDYIVEGREMASVFPDAKIHYYFHATPEARISRYVEKKQIAIEHDEFCKMCDDLRVVDEKDINRENNPLRIPKNAIIVDVGKLEFTYTHIFNYVIHTITKQFKTLK